MGQEKMNMRNESLIKAMGGLGGGIAADSRGICGALLGGVAFISSLYGRGNRRRRNNPGCGVQGKSWLKNLRILPRNMEGSIALISPGLIFWTESR